MKLAIHKTISKQRKKARCATGWFGPYCTTHSHKPHKNTGLQLFGWLKNMRTMLSCELVWLHVLLKEWPAEQTAAQSQPTSQTCCRKQQEIPQPHCADAPHTSHNLLQSGLF